MHLDCQISHRLKPGGLLIIIHGMEKVSYCEGRQRCQGGGTAEE